MDDPHPMTRGRVLLAKPGMDAHWRGIAVVARVLRDAGYEVIYLGHAGPTEIVAVAIQEDVDVIGLSTLSGNHLSAAVAVIAELEAAGVRDRVSIVVGGAIPPTDVAALVSAGVARVLTATARRDSIICAIEEAVRAVDEGLTDIERRFSIRST